MKVIEFATEPEAQAFLDAMDVEAGCPINHEPSEVTFVGDGRHVTVEMWRTRTCPSWWSIKMGTIFGVLVTNAVEQMRPTESASAVDYDEGWYGVL